MLATRKTTAWDPRQLPPRLPPRRDGPGPAPPPADCPQMPGRLRQGGGRDPVSAAPSARGRFPRVGAADSRSAVPLFAMSAAGGHPSAFFFCLAKESRPKKGAPYCCVIDTAGSLAAFLFAFLEPLVETCARSIIPKCN